MLTKMSQIPLSSTIPHMTAYKMASYIKDILQNAKERKLRYFPHM